MPFPLFNSIASWFLKKRIHQIELFLKYPVEVQQEVLMDLINFAKKTKIGYQYDFNSIKSYTEFKQRVPIRSYEEISEEVNKCREGEDNLFWPTKIKWYAKSSGTTDSRSKFIPVSTEALENCHYKAGKDMLSLYINNNPDTQLFTGKSLRLGGSQELHQNQQNYFGDLSSIIIDNLEGKLYFNLADLTQLFFSISFLLCLRLTQNKLSQFLKTTFLIISSFETVLFPET